MYTRKLKYDNLRGILKNKPVFVTNSDNILDSEVYKCFSKSNFYFKRHTLIFKYMFLSLIFLLLFLLVVYNLFATIKVNINVDNLAIVLLVVFFANLFLVIIAPKHNSSKKASSMSSMQYSCLEGILEFKEKIAFNPTFEKSIDIITTLDGHICNINLTISELTQLRGKKIKAYLNSNNSAFLLVVN